MQSPPQEELVSKKRKSLDGTTSPSSTAKTHRKKKTPSRPKASLKGDVPPLGKFLASNDKQTRDRAVTALHKFLTGKSAGELSSEDELFATPQDLPSAVWKPIEAGDLRLDGLELAKLYKGLFYCYWMSDKPIVQQHLADELAQLSLVVRPSRPSLKTDPALAQMVTTQCGLMFWKGFWDALAREWHGVDKHRIDKYLMLIRRFVEAGFKLLQRVRWSPGAITLWADILQETVFNVADQRTPLSITYHFSDIFLQELNRVLERTPCPPAPIKQLLRPLCHAVSRSPPGTAVFRKVIENIFDPLFENLDYFISDHTKQPSSCTIEIYPAFESCFVSSEASSNTATCTAARELKTEALKLVFETGSDPKCLDANRRKLYSYWASKGGAADDE